MAGPKERFKLPRGMGSLIRYSTTGCWTWERRDSRNARWLRIDTEEANRSKAEQWVYQRAATDRVMGRRLPGASILFSTVATTYIDSRTRGSGCKHLRKSAIQKIKTTVRAFQKYIGSGYKTLAVDKIDASMLHDFVQQESARISVGTVNARLAVLSQILAFALKKNYISNDPAPKVERAFADPVEDDDSALCGWPCPTPKEMQQILSHARPQLIPTGETAFNGSVKGRQVLKGINANDYTDLYAAICMTGMRRSEALFLTWNDVDLNNKVILIRPGKKNGSHWQPKTRASIRRIAIVPQLEEILIRLRDNSRNNLWVFESRRGTQMSLFRPTQRLGEICDELGFKQRYVLHSLRKYWASTVAQQGMDWRVMLKMFGHHDFELILSTYYAQNDDVRMLAEASKVDFGLNLNSLAPNFDENEVT